MRDAGLVGGRKPLADLPDDRQREIERQSLVSDHRRQIDAFDERHRDELDVADLPQVVDAHHVLVRDLPRDR